MKVAVTGASGFIGRYLLRELISRGVETVALVRNTKLENVSGISKILTLDIYNPPENALLIMGNPDVLIHLAWGGLPNYQSFHHFETELPVHYKFLKALVLAGLPSLLVAGTCFEYGMISGELTEDTPAQPINPYGFAKDALRRQLEFLKKRNPFKLTWVRLFYLYGDGQAPTSLWSQLKKAVERGEKKFPMSGGEQLRDYLHVKEAAHYLAALALLQKDVGIVNVCSGQPISIRHLVESWINQNGWDIKPDLGRYPYPDYEPLAFWGNRKKLDLILNPEKHDI